MKKTSGILPKSILMQLVLYSLSLAVLTAATGCTLFGESKATLAKRRVLQQVRASMVPVKIHFKRDIANEFYSDSDEVSYQERLNVLFCLQTIQRNPVNRLGKPTSAPVWDQS